jgi:hypothetical protein
MGRANNTSRSLKIASRAQGWDPDKIVDTHFDNPVATHDLYPAYHERETPMSSDTGLIEGVGDELGTGRTPPQGKPHAMPADTRQKPQRTRNADPTPGMPGA